jgi:hypothetical protein
MDSLCRRSLTAVAVAVALAGASCGVASDDVAATYEGAEIQTATVDALASDAAFAELFGFQIGQSTAVVESVTARTVLDFLLQGQALMIEARDQGLDVRPDQAALAATVEGLQQQGYSYALEDLSDEARAVLSRFVVADQLLAESGGSVGSPTRADLRFVYDETQSSGRWERTCLTMVAALATEGDAMADAIADGVDLAEIPGVVPEAQVALDPQQACATAADLAGLPPGLAAEVESAEIGLMVGPVEVEQPEGPPLVVFFEVESTEKVDFDSALEELEAEVAQSLLAVRVARFAEVNPRYGDGVGLESAASETGESALVARVQRPQAPQVEPLPGAVAAP